MIANGLGPNSHRSDGGATPPGTRASRRFSPRMSKYNHRELPDGAPSPQPMTSASGSITFALHLAARHGNRRKVESLIREGIDVHQVDGDGLTALYVAAQCGHVEIVQMLLQAGARVRATKSNGSTALHIAAAKGHLPVVSTLVQ